MSRKRKNSKPWAWVTTIPWPVWLSLTLTGAAVAVVLVLTERSPAAAVVALFVTYLCAAGFADSLRARRVVRKTGRKGARR